MDRIKEAYSEEAYSEATYIKLKDFFLSLTTDNIKTKALGNLKLEDLIDLYSFQNGAYRTISDSGILVQEACRVFGSAEYLPLYRGTDSKAEIESIEKSGQLAISDHAVSFSKDKDTASSFGKFLIKVVQSHGVKCFDLQGYVSALIKVMSEDLDLKGVANYIRGYPDHPLYRFLTKETDPNISITDIISFKEYLDDPVKSTEILQSRAQTYRFSSMLYTLILCAVSLREDGEKFPPSGKTYDPIEMEDEQEVLVPPSVFARVVSRTSAEIEIELSTSRFPASVDKPDSNETLQLKCLSVQNGVLSLPTWAKSVPKKAFAGKSSRDNTPFTVDLSHAREVGQAAFKGADTDEVVWSNQLKKIGSEAFSYTSVHDLIFPASLESLEEEAFSHIYDLKTAVFTGDSLKKIGPYVFSNCYGLQEVDLPRSLESLGEGVFYDCVRLSSVSLPESLSEVGENCFTNCSLTVADFSKTRVQIFPRECFSRGRLGKVEFKPGSEFHPSSFAGASVSEFWVPERCGVSLRFLEKAQVKKIIVPGDSDLESLELESLLRSGLREIVVLGEVSLENRVLKSLSKAGVEVKTKLRESV